jgi:hypothetical protein
MVTNFKLENSFAPALANEVIKIISAMPRWIPGYCNGKPVYTKVVLPFKYSKKQ